VDKRYQVFVSSTFEDLREERQKTIEAVLSCDCIPIGMEYFAAGDETQWALIKRVIAECDYYIVIVAGRYGSVDANGKSYTQKEYEFAVEKDIPVMAFLHGEPGKIPNEKSETSADGKVKLEEFRNHCKKRICKDWTSPDGLAGQVAIALNQAKKTHPRTGWVRADQVDDSATKEILKLRRQVDSLRTEVATRTQKPPEGADMLAQGDDTLVIPFSYKFVGSGGNIGSRRTEATISWNELFGFLAPFMLEWIADYQIAEHIGELARSRTDVHAKAHDYHVDSNTVNTIKIQLRALGLIERQEGAFAWRITPYGDNIMTRIRAIKRSE